MSRNNKNKNRYWKICKNGIISDFQLDVNIKNISLYKYFEYNVIKALSVFKKNKIDILIIPGDTTNKGKSEEYLIIITKIP